MSFVKGIKRRIFPSSLYGRSLTIIILPIFLIQLVVAVIFIDRPWDSMVGKLAFALAGEVDVISQQIERGVEIDPSALAMRVEIHPKGYVVKGDSHPIGFTWENVEQELRRQLTHRFGNAFAITTSPENRQFTIYKRTADGRTLAFTNHERRLTSPTTYIFILWLIGSSILLMGVAVLFMKNQIRPIRRLAVVAEKLGKGQDVSYFKVEGAREVRQASKAFLEMRDRIRRQIEQRTAVLAGVSHDIKTPLTRMRLQLAMMEDSDDVQKLRSDIDEMEKMLEGYLTFARGEESEDTEMANIRTMLERVVQHAQRQGSTISMECPEKVMLRLRPIAMERVFSNLVLNACKYAENVWVSVQECESAIEIRVEDDGPGIEEKEKAEVFKPFYRVEKSRNRKTGGTGLGLSIAQDIVHSHGGDIVLEDSNKGGLSVVVRLPV